MDNYKVLILCIASYFLGMLVTIAIFAAIINVIGDSIHVESVNTTISLNQSMLIDTIERMNQSRST